MSKASKEFQTAPAESLDFVSEARDAGAICKLAIYSIGQNATHALSQSVVRIRPPGCMAGENRARRFSVFHGNQVRKRTSTQLSRHRHLQQG